MTEYTDESNEDYKESQARIDTLRSSEASYRAKDFEEEEDVGHSERIERTTTTKFIDLTGDVLDIISEYMPA
jgi:hypothetical protein